MKKYYLGLSTWNGCEDAYIYEALSALGIKNVKKVKNKEIYLDKFPKKLTCLFLPILCISENIKDIINLVHEYKEVIIIRVEVDLPLEIINKSRIKDLIEWNLAKIKNPYDKREITFENSDDIDKEIIQPFEEGSHGELSEDFEHFRDIYFDPYDSVYKLLSNHIKYYFENWYEEATEEDTVQYFQTLIDKYNKHEIE